jgi:putative FmdB family regulatory protein
VPTYQYACTACGEQLEAAQAFTDAPLTECPACSGRLRKVFSAVGVVFKGSGFYKTDSRAGSKSESSGVKAEGGAAKDGGSAGGAKVGGSATGGAKDGGSAAGGSTAPAKGGSSSSAPVAKTA